VTATAGVSDQHPATAAFRAGLLHREKTLGHAHLTNTAAGATGGRLGSLAGAAAITDFAAHQAGHADGGGDTPHCFLQVELEVVAQVRTPRRAAATATTAENIAKYIAENIAETTGTTLTTSAIAETFMTKAVVGGALFGIGEHFIGLGGFLEFVLGIVVVGIAVGVVFHRHPPVRLLDVSLRGAPIDAQYFVVIPFSHSVFPA